jgi:hypothetical protein
MPKLPCSLVALSILLSITTTTAYATVDVQQQEQPTEVMTTNSTIYTDDTGFTVSLPHGWRAVDYNNTSQEAKEIAASQLREILVEFCPPRQGSVVNAANSMPCNDDIPLCKYGRKSRLRSWSQQR